MDRNEGLVRFHEGSEFVTRGFYYVFGDELFTEATLRLTPEQGLPDPYKRIWRAMSQRFLKIFAAAGQRGSGEVRSAGR